MVFSLSGYVCPSCPSAIDPAGLMAAIHPAYNTVNVAFVGWETDGSIIEQFHAPEKDFMLTKDAVTALREDGGGREVIVSIGGGDGGVIDSPAPAGFVDTMVLGLLDVVERYGFDGVDFDIEHRSGDLEGCASIMNDVIAGLADASSDLVITIAPQMPNLNPDVPGTFAAGCNELAPVVGESMDALSWVQPQMYNSWSAVETTDYAKQYVAELIAGYNITLPSSGTTVSVSVPASKMRLGYPATASGAGSGYIQPAELVTMVRDLQKSGVDLGGLMTWSIGWDQQEGWPFAEAVAELQ